MPTERIFQIGEAELARVRELAFVIWPAHYAPIIGPELIPAMVRDIYAIETLTADIGERGHIYWLATLDGKDVGYASAYLEDGRLWIKKLYLLADARGRGLGKGFIEAIREYFGREKAQALYVADGNATALDFYRSQGFVVVGKEPVEMGPYHFEDFVLTRPGEL